MLTSGIADAQLGIGGGFQYGTAMFVNNPFFVRRPNLGLCDDLSYRLHESRLFPSISYVAKNISVPVRNSHFADQEDLAKYHNFALKLNYYTDGEQHYKLVYAGIGLANITPATYMSDNLGNQVNLVDTSNTHLYPMVQAGIKYMKRILPNTGFYISFEGYIQYIYMQAQNHYTLQQNTLLAPADISGNVVLPGVEVKLEYVFGRGKEWD